MHWLLIMQMPTHVCDYILTGKRLHAYRAANAFPTPVFQEMRHKAIAQDLSWLKPARKWEAVLEGLLTGSSEAKDRGAAVRTPVQTPENVARTEKTAALREEAKVRCNR